MGVRRESQSGGPARPMSGTSRVQDDRDVMFGQPLNTADERGGTAKAVAILVDALSGQKQAVRLVGEAGVNDLLGGNQRGVCDDAPRFFSNWPRAVHLMIERKSRRVNATKRFHLGIGSA